MGFWIFWITAAIVVGIVASGRGRSGFGYFVLSLLLSPLIGAVLALGLPAKRQAAGGADVPSDNTHVRCPACAEWVLPEARTCKHCGAQLTPDTGFGERNAKMAKAREREEATNLLIGLGFVVGVIGLFILVGKLL